MLSPRCRVQTPEISVLIPEVPPHLFRGGRKLVQMFEEQGQGPDLLVAQCVLPGGHTVQRLDLDRRLLSMAEAGPRAVPARRAGAGQCYLLRERERPEKYNDAVYHAAFGIKIIFERNLDM